MRSSSRGGRACSWRCLALAIDEPKRSAPAGPRPDFRSTWRELYGVPLYRNAVFGYIAQTFAIGGFAAWAPTYLNRELQMDLKSADFWFGLILVVSGLFATFIGGYLGDRWPGQDRARANLRVCAFTTLASVPFAFYCLLAGSPVGFFVGIGVAEFAIFLSTSPINVVILRAVPEGLRASAMAMSIFAIHLFGDMISPPLVGAVSDAWTLRAGMFVLPAALVIAAFAWLRGSREWTASPARA